MKPVLLRSRCYGEEGNGGGCGGNRILTRKMAKGLSWKEVRRPATQLSQVEYCWLRE